MRGEGRRSSVLVVEDTRDHRELYASELRAAGFAVLEASDGNAALFQAVRSRPEAIVLDLMLPGVNGFHVARILKADERTRHSSIIAVTALTSETFRNRALEAGCDAFLRKPVEGSAVVAAVLRLLSESGPAPSGA
jgi:DNA-binding response OmpR family regulator